MSREGTSIHPKNRWIEVPFYLQRGTVVVLISRGIWVLCAALVGFMTRVGDAEARFFTDVTATLGIIVPADADRLAWVDVDGDGDLDLYVGVRGQPDVLFQNNGAAFTRTTSLGPLAISETGAAWGDFNADGRLDVFLADTTASGLYVNQGGGMFTNTIGASGIAPGGWQGDAQWVDYDGDLDLDLTLVDTTGTIALYLNDGSGSFTDVGVSVGLTASGSFEGVTWADVDNDGDPDLFLPAVSATEASRLYRNAGGLLADNAGPANLTFSDSLQTGSSWADVEGDGDLDLFIAHRAPAQDRLLTNNGNAVFTDITTASGVGATTSSVAHGWADYDNDGAIDLFVATPDAPLLYRNLGMGVFAQVATLEGIPPTGGVTSAAWGDYDADGDPDLFLAATALASSVLYRNDSDVGQRWLSLRLTGSGGEAGGIGSRVTIDVDGVRQTRYVGPQVGRTSHHQIDAVFGLGSAVVVDSVSLQWPSGDTQTFLQVSSNQVLALSQSAISPEVRIEIPNVFATSSLVQIPIEISQFLSPDSIRSAEITVAYDGSELRFDELTSALTKTDGWNVVTNAIDGVNDVDTLRVATFTDAFAVTGDGTLLRLTFELLEGTATVDLVSVLFNDGSPSVGLLSGGVVRSRGSNAVLSVSPIPLGPREELTITLVDVDANSSDASNDSAVVVVTNPARGDTSNVTVRETGPASGRFVAVLPSDHGTEATVGDGIITGLAGDTLDVVWEDQLTDTGVSQTALVRVALTGGTNGIILAQPDTISPTDSIRVIVLDPDRDRKITQHDSLFVRVFAAANSDTESVYLRETDRSSGVFARTFPTAWDSNGVATGGTNDDGTFTVALTDSIQMEYLDSLAESGDTTRIGGIAHVIPWQDADLAVSFVVQASPGKSVRDIVRIQLDDSDENALPEQIETITARLVNRVSGEFETLNLVETESGSGRFRVSLATVQDTMGTDDDGVLSISANDSLNVAFFDSLTSTGVPDSVFATTFVVEQFGDLDQNGSIQAFDASLILEFSVDEALPDAPVRSFEDFLIGDVDGSSTITGFDASLTARFVVGLIQEFPVQTDLVMTPPEDTKNHPFLKPVSGPRARIGTPVRDGETLIFPLILSERSQVVSIVADIMTEGGRITGVLSAEPYVSFMKSGKAHEEGYAFALAGAEALEEGEGAVVRLIVEPELPERMTDLVLRHLSLNGLVVPIPRVVPTVLQDLPLHYAFRPNFPNPFNPETTVGFDLPESSQVRIYVYNVLGQLIRTLVDRHYEPGTHTIVWDGHDAVGASAATGVYILQLQTEAFSSAQKVLLLR